MSHFYPFLFPQTNMYEQQRATLLADMGYVGFAADIFGATLQNDLSMEVRIAQSSLYRNENTTLFFSRMQTAIDLVKSFDYVDENNVALIGYCFGGVC